MLREYRGEELRGIPRGRKLYMLEPRADALEILATIKIQVQERYDTGQIVP